MTAVTLKKVRVSETHSRDVHIEFTNAPTISTPRGDLPIRPQRARFHYTTDDGRLWSIEIYGQPTEQRDIERRTRRTWSRGKPVSYVDGVKRRVDPGALPLWLADLVEEYRP